MLDFEVDVPNVRGLVRELVPLYVLAVEQLACGPGKNEIGTAA